MGDTILLNTKFTKDIDDGDMQDQDKYRNELGDGGDLALESDLDSVGINIDDEIWKAVNGDSLYSIFDIDDKKTDEMSDNDI